MLFEALPEHWRQALPHRVRVHRVPHSKLHHSKQLPQALYQRFAFIRSRIQLATERLAVKQHLQTRGHVTRIAYILKSFVFELNLWGLVALLLNNLEHFSLCLDWGPRHCFDECNTLCVGVLGRYFEVFIFVRVTAKHDHTCLGQQLGFF